MLRGKACIRQHLNTWDEICVDEKARFRTNTILCTLITSVFFIAMLLASAIGRQMVMLLPTALLACVSIGLLLLQFFRKAYSAAIAWSFGVMALLMSAYLLYSGGLEGYSYLWIFIVPNIAVMVVSVRSSVVYNGLLLLVILVLLDTPVKTFLPHSYTPTFCILFPIAIVFVTACVYLAELVRHRTQARLVESAAKLQAFAFTDPLTGAFNRHALTSHFGDLDGGANGLSFAIFDLDRFKDVNDRHGHIVGDEMLCHVVNVVKAGMPANALLYRWGGEEFLLVLKTGDAALFADTLQSICRAVAQNPMPYAQESIGITVSIGGVCAGSSTAIAACIAQADTCLYRAKAAGRNQVVLAGEERG